jgi:NAD(P)H-dependent flavin oxidoreductase YrpB (nitropropane dioxygenase family)
VDVSREFMPCGQGVGAIAQLEHAGDVVRHMVEEAEAVLARVSALRR